MNHTIDTKEVKKIVAKRLKLEEKARQEEGVDHKDGVIHNIRRQLYFTRKVLSISDAATESWGLFREFMATRGAIKSELETLLEQIHKEKLTISIKRHELQITNIEFTQGEKKYSGTYKQFQFIGHTIDTMIIMLGFSLNTQGYSI